MNDEHLYEVVALELSERQLRPGLWTKAISESDGSEAGARAAYIRLRVAQLKEAAQQERSAQSAARLQKETRKVAEGTRRVAFTFADTLFRLVIALLGIVLVLCGVIWVIGPVFMSRHYSLGFNIFTFVIGLLALWGGIGCFRVARVFGCVPRPKNSSTPIVPHDHNK